ncbi:MAG: alanine racemase [Chlamydiae bacterium]|nr:alanine racemase [Chlamydiota bacterium]MBI3277044.1 alanine racemase [Chlamydiota bacterium]
MPVKILASKASEKVWAEINQEALSHNIKTIRSIIGPKVSLLGVVKADAYGLGLLEISKILLKCSVNALGVTNVEEGILIRKTFSEVPIVILGPSFSDYLEDALEWNLIPVVSSLELLKKLNEIAFLMGKKARVHLMIDTGMGRMGLWYEKGEDFFQELLRLESVVIEGVASHFASSDGPHLEFSKLQLSRFQDFLFRLKMMGFKVSFEHMANSSALLRLPDSFFNMVRIGILLYGAYPSPFLPRGDFQPVLSWKTKIAFIKEVEPGRPISYGSSFVTSRKTKVGTLPIGYSHGYDRALSNRGEVLVGGKRCPVVGRVTMDQIMIDLGPESIARVDEEVVLLGTQGEQEMTLEELAEKADTIPYELMCRMKVKKIYV